MPKRIKAPKGYKLLKKGELITSQSLFLDSKDNTWKPTSILNRHCPWYPVNFKPHCNPV